MAVYICTGCDIGDAIDVSRIKKLINEEFNISMCKEHPFLCGPEGKALITQDIENKGVNTIIICACSPRVNNNIFDFGPDKIVERVNLREHVAWSQPPKDEDTQMLAEDYVRMGCSKANHIEIPEPYKPEEEYSRDVLIVGGGLAGITAAIEVAEAGYKAIIVEKEKRLGGFLNKMKKKIAPPYDNLHDTELEELLKEVEQNPNIKVYKSATVERIRGAPGLFSVEIKTNDDTLHERAGAIIQATGWTPYEPNRLEHLGYGRFEDVITSVQLEEMASNGRIKRPSDGQAPKKVLFIQCAGQRDPEHLPYCSSVCCLISLKQVSYIKEQDPEAVCYILFKDMRIVGQAEEFYKKSQLEGNVFIRGSIVDIGEEGGKLFIEADDEFLEERIRIEELDLIVLATGMVPNSKPKTVPKIKAPEGVEGMDEQGMIEVPPDSGFYATPALNLEYRQGPELPTLEYGFPDSHFICFPYETRRTGIYAAGCLRRPMETSMVIDDAAGAALKAIQCIKMTEKGMAVHPRSGDISYPEVNLQRCTQCKRCTEECPFGAINEDEKANPLFNPTRCRRCGICMGSCPERIISFKDYSITIIGNMIKKIYVPEEEEEKPRIVVFVCENDAYPALDMAGIKRLRWSPYARFIPVRCLGSLNLVWIADALSCGIDGILLLGCKHGDDYQCHFVKGSELASIRLSRISETLDRLALESGRVRFEEVGISDYWRIPQIIEDFMETIDKIGPNPYKGWQ